MKRPYTAPKLEPLPIATAFVRCVHPPEDRLPALLAPQRVADAIPEGDVTPAVFCLLCGSYRACEGPWYRPLLVNLLLRGAGGGEAPSGAPALEDGLAGQQAAPLSPPDESPPPYPAIPAPGLCLKVCVRWCGHSGRCRTR